MTDYVDESTGADRSSHGSSRSTGPQTLYWYMTNTCNQRCAHCWVSAGTEFGAQALRLGALTKFFDDATADGLRTVKLTGGEPLLYPDFREACSRLHRLGLRLWLETNATRIDEGHADFIARMQMDVGISLDDVSPEEHDEFRGRPDSWTRTVQAIRLLIDRGVLVSVTSSLTESNMSTLEDLCTLVLDDLKASHLALNPITPHGRALQNSLATTWKQTEILLEVFGRLVEKYGSRRLRLGLPPALVTSRGHHNCRLGDEILSLLPDGTLSICGIGMGEGRVIHLGNACHDRLLDVWKTHPSVRRLRQRGHGTLRGVCANCVFVNSCRGDCRAMALTAFRAVDAPHPICQMLADIGKFPATYLIDPAGSIEYQPAADDIREAEELFPLRAPDTSRSASTSEVSRH